MDEYFVKNSKIHRYPIPKNCNVRYEKDKRYKLPPQGYEKCYNCFPSR